MQMHVAKCLLQLVIKKLNFYISLNEEAGKQVGSENVRMDLYILQQLVQITQNHHREQSERLWQAFNEYYNKLTAKARKAESMN